MYTDLPLRTCVWLHSRASPPIYTLSRAHMEAQTVADTHTIRKRYAHDTHTHPNLCTHTSTHKSTHRKRLIMCQNFFLYRVIDSNQNFFAQMRVRKQSQPLDLILTVTDLASLLARNCRKLFQSHWHSGQSSALSSVLSSCVDKFTQNVVSSTSL